MKKSATRQGAIRGKLKDRKHDLYETPACATQALIRTGILNQYRVLFEPCAGRGAISRELKAGGWRVISHDLVKYEGADSDVQSGIDFLKAERGFYLQAIVTNPPFKDSDAFVRHGLDLGFPVIAFLRLMALEGAGRSDIMQHLQHVFIGVERLPMMHREGWKGKKLKEGAMPFGWFVFRPGRNIGGFFSASRISWREENKNGLDVDSSAPGPAPLKAARTGGQVVTGDD